MFIKRFLYYFIWTVVIGLVIYGGLLYQIQLNETAQQTYNMLGLLRFAVIFPVIIGLLLRLPTTIIEVKEKKINSFDWSKFLAVGVPTFLVLLMLFIPFIPILSPFMSSTIPTIAGIVFGYVLLDSFSKK